MDEEVDWFVDLGFYGLLNSCIYFMKSTRTRSIFSNDFTLKRFYTQNDRVRVNKATSTRTRYKSIFSTSLFCQCEGYSALYSELRYNSGLNGQETLALSQHN